MTSELARLTGWIATELERTGIDAFERPLWLLLTIPAVVAFAISVRTRPAAVGWSAYREARAAGGRRLDLVRATSVGFRAIAVLALIGVLAGPVGQHRRPPEPGFGLDMVLVVDASGSMRALDARRAGAPLTRIALAREVVARFAKQRAAAGDRVALVVFGDSAFTQCPLTSDGTLLSAALDRVEAGIAGEATALGDALALAVKRALGGTRSDNAGELLAGRVVVLLTDGRNNSGAVSIELATALAAAEGIRVHTVAIGSMGDEVAMAPNDANRLKRHPLEFERHDVDAEALERIASATHGRFFPVRDSRDLDTVYGDIDALERVARPLPPRIHHWERPEPLLAVAGTFLLAEIATARVLRRRIT